MYKLYVIPGSHACRAAMLMLDHKGVEYEVEQFVTLTHPVMSRLRGFDAGGQTRVAGRRRTLGIRLGDMLGTVPGLACDGRRVSTNHGIARFLEAEHPSPPLFPSDPAARAKVEEVEAWANETLQMAARRILGVAAVRDPDGFSRDVGDGRMGYLLYRSERVRRLVIPNILGRIFAVKGSDDAELLGDLRTMLDCIDAWIGEGVIGGDEANVADCMVAPSLALILYRRDVRPLFEGRPALALVDRLLPEPTAIA